jgi:predicted NUDIX family phosphoesterase
MNKMDEVVFAIKTKELGPLFQGFQIPPDKEILDKIYSKCIPLTRGECENNPKYKHIIPYVVLKSENCIFVVRRTTNQTEKRLHNKASIGIGGHIGPIRGIQSTEIVIKLGMLRELKEEIDYSGVNCNRHPKLIGLVNDDTTQVGSVHFGLVYEWRIPYNERNSLKIKETENMIGEWMELRDAIEIDNYENWSKLILRI